MNKILISFILLTLFSIIYTQTGGIPVNVGGSAACNAKVTTGGQQECNDLSNSDQVCCQQLKYAGNPIVETMSCKSYDPTNIPLNQYLLPGAVNSVTTKCGATAVNGTPAVGSANSGRCNAVPNPNVDTTCTQFFVNNERCCLQVATDSSGQSVNTCGAFQTNGIPPLQQGPPGAPGSTTRICEPNNTPPAGGVCLNCPTYSGDDKADPSDDKFEDCNAITNPSGLSTCTSVNDQWKNPCCIVFIPGQVTGFRRCRMNPKEKTFNYFIDNLIPPGWQANCNGSFINAILIIKVVIIIAILIV